MCDSRQALHQRGRGTFQLSLPREQGVNKSSSSGTVLESPTIEGDSPVCDRGKGVIRSLSKTRHVEARPKLRGPSRKAKYCLVTDSERSSASERWEEPRSGEDTEPETTCLQAVGGLYP